MLKPLIRHPLLTICIIILVISCMALAAIVRPPAQEVQRHNQFYDQAYGMVATVTRVEAGGFYYVVPELNEPDLEWFYQVPGNLMQGIKVGDKYRVEKTCNLGFCQHKLVRLSG